MSTVRQAAKQKASTPAKVSPKTVIRDLLDENKQAIGLSLPSGMDADRFARLLLTAANTNPDLFKCDPRSFLAAGVACAQLGLEPNDARGLAYLIPFKDKRRGMVVNLILGYRGMMDLARRSGLVTSINAFPVYAGDEFEYQLGLHPDIHHVPCEGDEDPAAMTHVYATAKVGGDPQFVVLTRRMVDRARDASPGAKAPNSPWRDHYVAMAQKTAIRRLSKYLPQTVEVAEALERDERPLELGDLGTITVDNEPIEAAGTEVTADPETGEVVVATTDGADDAAADGERS